MAVTNKSSLLPDVQCFCTKTSSRISQHWRGHSWFHDFESPLFPPSQFHTRKSSHRSCRSGEEMLLPKEIQVVKLTAAQFLMAILVLCLSRVVVVSSLCPSTSFLADTLVCFFSDHYLSPSHDLFDTTDTSHTFLICFPNIQLLC
jgi:hypothetical protein